MTVCFNEEPEKGLVSLLVTVEELCFTRQGAILHFGDASASEDAITLAQSLLDLEKNLYYIHDKCEQSS